MSAEQNDLTQKNLRNNWKNVLKWIIVVGRCEIFARKIERKEKFKHENNEIELWLHSFKNIRFIHFD